MACRLSLSVRGSDHSVKKREKETTPRLAGLSHTAVFALDGGALVFSFVLFWRPKQHPTAPPPPRPNTFPMSHPKNTTRILTISVPRVFLVAIAVESQFSVLWW